MGFAHAGKDSRLAHVPSRLGPGQGQRSLVAVDRGAAFHAPPGAVAGDQQRIRCAVGNGPVVGVEIDGGESRQLEVVRGQGGMPSVEEESRHELMQPETLPLGQARVNDLLQGRVAEPPEFWLARLRVAHDHLRVFELL